MPRSPGVFDRAAALVALVISLLIAPATIDSSKAQSDDNLLEYRVKAAVIYNFTKFIEWPQPGLDMNSQPSFEMCVLGDEEVPALLRNTVRGRDVRGSAVAVRELTSISEAGGCELVFVTRSLDGMLPKALAAAPAGVLTIAEASGLEISGAVINLILDDGRVGFEIDIERAHRAGLRISSNLLKLARLVGPRGRR